MPQKNWPNFSKQLISNVGKILNSGKINYTTGSHGKKFEKEFSNFVGNKYSIAICNGTVALEVAIKSLKLPKNSEILVPIEILFKSITIAFLSNYNCKSNSCNVNIILVFIYWFKSAKL